MSGFRVAEHQEWRHATTRLDEPAPAAEPTTEVPEVDLLRRRVEALGALAYPARLYDGVFGRLQTRSRVFLVLRFLLVLMAVVLLVGGVNGEGLVAHSVGAYHASSATGVVPHHLAPSAAQKYIVQTAVGLPGQVFSVMGLDHGTVRVPTLDPEGPEAYGLHVKLVRADPYVRPLLAMQHPDGRIEAPLPPTHDDGVTVRYDVIRIEEPGDYTFVLKSASGTGRVDMHIGVVAAPVQATEQFRPDWMPLIGGVALGTVLLGAYTPGAAALAQVRRARIPDHPYRMAQDPAADGIVSVRELDARPDARLAYRE